MSRRVIWLVCLAVGLLVLHVVAREAVAAAVALAPNAGRTEGGEPNLPLPAVLTERGAFPFKTRAGSPAATISSWVVESGQKPVKGTIVLLHGVRMDKSSLAGLGAALADAGYRAVLVDLRGHGESSGRYLTYGALESTDVSTVLDALTSAGKELGCTGVYGFSYGGAVALQIGASDPRVQAVVAVAPFASLREVVRDYGRKYLPAPLKLVPDSWLQGAVDEAGRIAGFDPEGVAPLRAVGRSAVNLLLIHGTADTQIPLRHSLKLATAAGPRASFLTVQGASHDVMPADPTGFIRRQTVAWFDRWFDGSACAR